MIKKMTMAICMIATTLVSLISCSGDDDSGPIVEFTTFTVEFSDLELIEGAIYEGWIIVDGNPVSTGRFNGSQAVNTFTTIKQSLEKATSFMVSIEPIIDADLTPSVTKLLSGTFVNNQAIISIDEVGDFSQVSGNFEIFTPSDIDATNEENGVWFVKTVNGVHEAGLVGLPNLSSGWRYEGWVVFGGVPVSTGTFTNPGSFDDSSPYSGNAPVPQFPGEDFVSSSFTSGITTLNFPADGDVTGKQVIISLEPYPDNSLEPFYIKPLIGTAGNDVFPASNSLLINVINRAPVGLVKR